MHHLSSMSNNDIIKYANDATVLVPEHTDTGLDIEFKHIIAWANVNHLKINFSNTKEIVLSSPELDIFTYLLQLRIWSNGNVVNFCGS